MVLDIDRSIRSTRSLPIREPLKRKIKADLGNLSSRTKARRTLSGPESSKGIPPHTASTAEPSRNAGDFMSTMELAALSAGRISYLLKRMHELSISASNTLLSELTRDELDKDFNSLRCEIERIVGGTRFEDRNLLDGSFNAITIHGALGAKTEEEPLEVKLSDFSIPKTLSSGIASKAAAVKTIETVKAAISETDEKSESFSIAAGRAMVALGNLKAAGIELTSTRGGTGITGEDHRSFIPGITMRLLAAKEL